METLRYLIDIILHLDKHLAELVTQYGMTTYLILFLIVFCETGLVVTPILPGDSLLFAAGALAGLAALDVKLLLVILFVAAVLGDTLNYHIGKYFGPRVLKPDSRIFRREYLDKTERFFARYGGKTIIIARFVPIVRTFAPFMAGVGCMSYPKFIFFNVVGAAIWVGSLVLAGYFFGNLEIVKNNFSLVILTIILVSVLPAIIEAWRARRSDSKLSIV